MHRYTERLIHREVTETIGGVVLTAFSLFHRSFLAVSREGRPENCTMEGAAVPKRLLVYSSGSAAIDAR